MMKKSESCVNRDCRLFAILKTESGEKDHEDDGSGAPRL